jgi:hypothetical protein
MFETRAPRHVALRLSGYLVVGTIVGCIIVYTPAVELLPTWIMDAAGLIYFGSLGLAIFIGLPVAIIIGIVQSVSSARANSSDALRGNEHG